MTLQLPDEDDTGYSGPPICGADNAPGRWQECAECRGTGSAYDDACPGCDGEGGFYVCPECGAVLSGPQADVWRGDQ
jgi:RecJ-like exonuclease